MPFAVEEIILQRDMKVALNVKISSSVNSHISIIFHWAAKKYLRWESGSSSLDYFIIISYQGDIRGNQKSSSKCSMTWRQIYEEKRCHYKNEEEKKKERSYSLVRKEDLKKVQKIQILQIYHHFGVLLLREREVFLGHLIKMRYCFSLFLQFQSFYYHSNKSSTASLSINSWFI